MKTTLLFARIFQSKMLLIKKVGEHIILLNEEMKVVSDIPDATFEINGETLVIVSKGEKAVELPKQQVGLLYK